jgi:hypothetical protein
VQPQDNHQGPMALATRAILYLDSEGGKLIARSFYSITDMFELFIFFQILFFTPEKEAYKVSTDNCPY